MGVPVTLIKTLRHAYFGEWSVLIGACQYPRSTTKSLSRNGKELKKKIFLNLLLPLKKNIKIVNLFKYLIVVARIDVSRHSKIRDFNA
jgi:hypothetical protein